MSDQQLSQALVSGFKQVKGVAVGLAVATAYLGAVAAVCMMGILYFYG